MYKDEKTLVQSVQKIIVFIVLYANLWRSRRRRRPTKTRPFVLLNTVFFGHHSLNRNSIQAVATSLLPLLVCCFCILVRGFLRGKIHFKSYWCWFCLSLVEKVAEDF